MASVAATFDPTAPYELADEVSIRDEEFGALAYHHGNRRLIFLKSRGLVEVVRALSGYPSARAAVAACVQPEECAAYEAALGSLARAEVVRGR